MKNTISIVAIVLLFTTINSQLCGVTGCSSCISNITCTNCTTRYFLSSGTCISCTDPNCGYCNPPGNNCYSCMTGYKPRATDTRCIACSNNTDQNCDSIFNSCAINSCATCLSYAINGNNQCLACNQVYRNCLTCNNTRCLTCASGFALNATANYLQCVVCAIPRCSLCTDSSTCYLCYFGYFSNNNTCQPCRLPCTSCSSLTSCNSCGAGYVYVSANHSCAVCNDSIVGIVGCLSCSIIIPNLVCLNCSAGYYIQNGTCSTCDPPCLTCIGSSLNCRSCVNNSYLYNSSITACELCATRMPNCTTCTTSALCLTCTDGFIINTNSNVCENCNTIFPGCLYCDISQCNTCLPGLSLQIDFTCSPICTSPCLMCTTVPTNCKSCIVGYYLSGTTCLQCNINCTDCLNLTYCLTCINNYYYANGTCFPCSVGQVFNPFTLACQNCSLYCTSCLWWTGCDTCASNFELTVANGVNICSDVCGDTYAISTPCDLVKGIANDGCTDQCTVQPSYNCTKTPNSFTINGTSTLLNTSSCSYIGNISISIASAQQSMFTNTLSLTFSIIPYLHGLPTNADTQSYVQSIFSLTPLGSLATYSVSIDSTTQKVTFVIDHTSDISQLGLTLQINIAPLAGNSMFQYMNSSSYSFQVNNILNYGRLGSLETADSLAMCRKLYFWSQCIAIVAVVIMIMGIFGKELVALDQIVLCQGMFLLINFYQGQLNLPLLSLSGLKYSTGFHFSDDPISLAQNQAYIMNLDSSSFVYNFNLNLIAYLLPLFLSFIILLYKLRYKHLPARRDLAQQTYEVIMGQTILYLAIFNFFPLVSYSYLFYTQSLKNNYYDHFAIFIGVIFTIFGIFNYFVKPQIVGIFRSCFRTESEYRQAPKTGCMQKYSKCISKICFQQKLSRVYSTLTINFYLIYLIYLSATVFVTVFVTSLQNILVVVMQGLILSLVLMVRPHFNVLQKLRSILTWVTTLLGGLIVLLKPNDFFMPAMFLMLLSVHLLMSVGVIVASLIQQIKRKCNDRSEVVRKLMKEGQVENQKAALRELILRYQNIDRKDITIDHEVEKIQLKFNDNDKNSKKTKGARLQQVAKIQGNKDEPDEEMIRFEDQIIEEQHDHFRFQKGMEFFSKYDGNIDKQLVNQEYPDIE